MTSTARVSAHCGKDKEVVIQLFAPVPNAESDLLREVVIQDGEGHDIVFYDNLQVVTFERLKA